MLAAMTGAQEAVLGPNLAAVIGLAGATEVLATAARLHETQAPPGAQRSEYSGNLNLKYPS